MALHNVIILPEGQIGVWHLTESSIELEQNFSSKELDNPEYRRFSYEKRKVEWLATRVLLKKMIGSNFLISYSEEGKPILSHPEYNYLSISHSRTFVVVYIHRNREVGIDLECIDRNYNAVEKRYLSATELNDTGGDSLKQCLYWCAKEAIFKLVPFDDLEFKQNIQVFPFNPADDKMFSACFNYRNETVLYSLDFQIFDNHCMVWVSQ